MSGVTQSSVIRQVTEDFLSAFSPNAPIDPPQIESDLLRLTQDAFDAYNGQLNGPDKAKKWRIPLRLTPYQIACVILRLHPIKLVMLAGENQDRDYGILSMYDPDEGIYSNDISVIHRLITLYDCNTSGRERDDIIRTLHDMAPMIVSTQDRDLIAVNNGIFDYKTKQLLPFSPDYVFTKKSKVNYNPNAVNTVIHNPADGTDWDVESWMEELSDDPEVTNLLWQICGAVLRPHVRWNKSAWFYSTTGNNGKGTLCAMLRNLCGPGSYASIPLEDFGKDFLLEPLVRAQAIIVDENNVGGFIDKAANLKAVITNDVIQINRKFKTPIALQFFGFMVQCLNEMPRVKDKSDSFYRRQLFIPFNKCFTGQERRYIKDDYLNRPEVLEYVLYKVLHMDYYVLDEPAACRAALNEYKEYNDSVRQFTYEMLPQCVWDLLPYQFLYDLYKSWFDRNLPSGTKQSKTTFIDNLSVIVDSDPNLPWRSCGRGGSGAPIRTGVKMSKTELLILDYNLTNWKNPLYRGTDPDVICSPPLRQTYRGLLRTVATVQSLVGDDDEGA